MDANQGFVQTTERRVQDLLKGNDKKDLEKYNRAICCCGSGMIGQIIFLIVMSSINFVFTIAALSSLIKKNAYYIILYTLYCPLKNNSILDDYLGTASSLLSGFTGTDSSFKTFWCGIGNFEDSVLISYLIFIILFICFEVLSLLIHKHIIKISIEGEGILYYILVGGNSLFFIIFYIYFPLLFYLFVYSIIVFSTTPNTPLYSGSQGADPDADNWALNIGVPIVNTVFIFLLYIFDGTLLKVKKSIELYLSMRYDNPNDNINLNNEKTKKKTLRIKEKNFESEIQSNQVTYLQRVGQNDKIYKFKKIKINELANDFIYLFLNNKAIEDQLSITDWEFPIFNELFLKLAKIAYLIYGLLFTSIPLFQLHLNKEYNYFISANYYSSTIMGISFDSSSKKPMFYSVYSSYGSFEFGTTRSRFSLYIVALFIILLCMGKRIIYGGYTRPIMILICFIASAIFIIENIIYVILSFLMILFSIFSLVCFYDINSNNSYPDEIIQAKLYVQTILNIIIFALCIRILIDNIQLTIMLNKLRKEYNCLNDGTESEDQEKIEGFQYYGLDNLPHILKEIQIEGHPRYIYYNLYGKAGQVIPQIREENDNNADRNSVEIRINNNNNINQHNLNNQTIQNNNQNNNQNNIEFTNIQYNQNNQNNQDNQNIRDDRTNVGGVDLLTLRNQNQYLQDENKRLKDELSRLKRSLGDIYSSLHQ